jgi:iron uptake system component EfeO
MFAAETLVTWDDGQLWGLCSPRLTRNGELEIVPMFRSGVVGVCSAAALLMTLGACTGGPPATPAAPAALTMKRGTCGAGWKAPHGGEQDILVHNADSVTMDVDLIDPATGGVYAEVDGFGAGTTRPVHVDLGRGDYAFRCLFDGADAFTGPTVKVTDGPARGAPAIKPVTEQDLRDAVTTYRAYVAGGLDTLVADAAALRGQVAAGDLGGARAAWLTAHLDYNRLGAAYDTFGDLGDAIDGMPDGLPDGVNDPGFTGLRRLEYGLWHGQALPSLAPPVDRLVADVGRLHDEFAKDQTDPNDLPRRAHEIMENAVQFELTGDADFGSGTGLATIDANLTGTQAVLDALAPVIGPRYAAWPDVATWMNRARALVVAQHHPDGTWTAPKALAPPDREKLDGAVGQLLETLAPIAVIGEVRRTS